MNMRRILSVEASHYVFVDILDSFSNDLLVFSKLGMSFKLFPDDIEEVLISFPEVHMINFLGLFAQ
jgi:hypothetical protein